VPGDAALCLTSTRSLQLCENEVFAEFQVRAGDSAAFVFGRCDDGTEPALPNVRWAVRAMRRTIVYWRRWIAGCAYNGEWGAEVRRSALALKLLQSRKTGAIIASPTFGLPEQIGGARNWDFRYTWIRDASFTVYALVSLGLLREVKTFARWVAKRCEESAEPGELQSFYRIDGRRDLTERALGHLAGHRNSRPVRIGNAAHDQLQLDIYGELIDALHLADLHNEPLSRSLWAHITALIEWLCRNWQRPDQGIWEVRSGSREFLYSRVMCWVALDRALRIASRRRFTAPREQWRATRDAIHNDVHASFWNEKLGAFVGAKGSTSVDAACLVMPLVGLISAKDARWQSTLRLVEARLVRDSLVRRYDIEDMDTDAGSLTAPSFTICSFWYIECLARGGEMERARVAMRKLVGHANHLGLYSEDIGSDGTLLGNFPQGLVHAALVGAAIALRDETAALA
jgi:GH15 family glucan-1,4-alpha-glucosidase